jgi:hypothetical protein
MFKCKTHLTEEISTFPTFLQVPLLCWSIVAANCGSDEMIWIGVLGQDLTIEKINSDILITWFFLDYIVDGNCM